MPVKAMFRSRKFLTGIMDALISTITLLATVYLAPDQADLVLILIGIWQVPIGLVIAMWGKEDAAAKSAGLHFTQHPILAGGPQGIDEDQLNAWFNSEAYRARSN